MTQAIQTIQTKKRENAASFHSQRFGFRHAYFRLCCVSPLRFWWVFYFFLYFPRRINMYDLVCCVSFSAEDLFMWFGLACHSIAFATIFWNFYAKYGVFFFFVLLVVRFKMPKRKKSTRIYLRFKLNLN